MTPTNTAETPTSSRAVPSGASAQPVSKGAARTGAARVGSALTGAARTGAARVGSVPSPDPLPEEAPPRIAPGMADPHAHSNVSDGTQPPAEVVARAAALGLAAIGLTDHDTTAGWGEAAEAAREYGITLLRGMEMSTAALVGDRDGARDGAQGGEHAGERVGEQTLSVHLLSYLHDPENAALLAVLDRARESRRTRARRMVERLAEDHPITWEDVLAQVGEGATVGRPHIADALVAAGVVADRNEAFASLLHHTSPYYARYWSPNPAEAVALVRRAGGVPIVAHPFAPTRGPALPDRVVEEMVEAGLAGIEVRHRDHDEAGRQRAAAFAERHGLLVTGSSDYHGAGKPNLLGENTTPMEVVHRIAEMGRLPLIQGQRA